MAGYYKLQLLIDEYPETFYNLVFTSFLMFIILAFSCFFYLFLVSIEEGDSNDMSTVIRGYVSCQRASAINIWNECLKETNIICRANWKIFVQQYADMKQSLVGKVILDKRASAEIPKEASPQTVDISKPTKILYTQTERTSREPTTAAPTSRRIKPVSHMIPGLNTPAGIRRVIPKTSETKPVLLNTPLKSDAIPDANNKQLALAAIELSIPKAIVSDGTCGGPSCDASETTLINIQPFEIQTCKDPPLSRKPETKKHPEETSSGKEIASTSLSQLLPSTTQCDSNARKRGSPIITPEGAENPSLVQIEASMKKKGVKKVIPAINENQKPQRSEKTKSSPLIKSQPARTQIAEVDGPEYTGIISPGDGIIQPTRHQQVTSIGKKIMSKDRELGASISKSDKRRTENQPNNLPLVSSNTIPEGVDKNENVITPSSSLFSITKPPAKLACIAARQKTDNKRERSIDPRISRRTASIKRCLAAAEKDGGTKTRPIARTTILYGPRPSYENGFADITNKNRRPIRQSPNPTLSPTSPPTASSKSTPFPTPPPTVSPTPTSTPFPTPPPTASPTPKPSQSKIKSPANVASNSSRLRQKILPTANVPSTQTDPINVSVSSPEINENVIVNPNGAHSRKKKLETKDIPSDQDAILSIEKKVVISKNKKLANTDEKIYTESSTEEIGIEKVTSAHRKRSRRDQPDIPTATIGLPLEQRPATPTRDTDATPHEIQRIRSANKKAGNLSLNRVSAGALSRDINPSPSESSVKVLSSCEAELAVETANSFVSMATGSGIQSSAPDKELPKPKRMIKSVGPSRRKTPKLAETKSIHNVDSSPPRNQCETDELTKSNSEGSVMLNTKLVLEPAKGMREGQSLTRLFGARKVVKKIPQLELPVIPASNTSIFGVYSANEAAPVSKVLFKKAVPYPTNDHKDIKPSNSVRQQQNASATGVGMPLPTESSRNISSTTKDITQRPHVSWTINATGFADEYPIEVQPRTTVQDTIFDPSVVGQAAYRPSSQRTDVSPR